MRKAAQLTQEQLGAMCDVSQPTINQWEKGQPPGYLNLLKVAKALGTTISLLTWEDHKPAAA